MDEEKNHISSGSHSINLGSNNSVENSSLHIGDVHNHAHSNQEPVAIIDRVYSAPFAILGAQIKSSWLIVSGAIGFISSIAGIVSFWQHLSLWFVLLFSFAMFSLIIGIAMVRHRFIRIPYLPFNFEADKSGKLFITKIEGDCPHCEGKLKLRDIGSKDNKTTYVRCTRNPSHIWNFDFTIFDEPQS